ncbi:MAG: ATP-dependent protease subunit HslV [candidate division Zixibacteria bacterium]|nr:ATP-dependent protease subunit HslV [candidate division Zixibacteria bacterium]NIR65440.1 ATP-dependent protease subunit HslV [candidate division Zixibacteria bacterium]NIS15306.1 ATP-dependent protease subunit HslV [candidate division Zixibacteria bacterium]NIS47131.1 ATP-dependent protease subunit HslV [candidate division Zixibacteria bacterium]NIT51830.1 ATP-dependent protease subunit HslV [candidate division Zixibacteria bacterium]
MIYHATTILGILHNGKAAIAGDGQVTLEDTIMKRTANKIRKLDDDNILAGFAGTAADAFTLFGRFEGKIEEFGGNLPRAAVELAKEWRTDKYLRRLEALLVALNKTHALVISGDGDVIEPDDGIVAIGSGGPYALAAARALMKNTRMNADNIARKALEIAAEICIYTNNNITVETL